MRPSSLVALSALILLAPSATAQSAVSIHCVPQRAENLERRASPYDSLSFTVGAEAAMLCYGRPSARDRVIFGGLVPYGQLWRTGANEPTTLHVPFAARIAGVDVGPGSYSLYTVPAEEGDWGVVVNASTSQWGHESRYEPVRDQEVGRGAASAERTEAHVETFTIRAEPRGRRRTDLVLEWENTRVRIPVEAVGAP